MKPQKAILFFMFSLVFLATLYGVHMKATYTDMINSNQAYTDYFMVAAMTESVAGDVCVAIEKELVQSSIVVEVTPVERREYFFAGSQQLVKVDEVHRGDTVQNGECIYITKESWCVLFDDMALNLGFVNEMKIGKKYLVFLENEIEPHTGENFEHRVFAMPNYIITPVFAFEDHKNTIIQIDWPKDAPTYVKYSDVANNEFFATTDEALEAFLNLKKRLFQSF